MLQENENIISRNFFRLSSATYGNCYTFNSNFSSLDAYAGKRKSSMPGANLGLDLVMKLDQDQYMRGGMTESAGARSHTYIG